MGKTNKNVYDVDLDGIYEEEIIRIMKLIDDDVKAYGKDKLLNYLESETPPEINFAKTIEDKKKIQLGYNHVIKYIKEGVKDHWTIRRKPNNKSKLWKHWTLYQSGIYDAVDFYKC